MKQIQKLFKPVLTQDEKTGYFVVEVPYLAPCITYETTIKEALEMAEEAIEGVIESRIELGYEIPDDASQFESSLVPIELLLPFSQPDNSALTA